MSEPLVSIIIVAQDEEENLRRCLSAVRRQTVDFDYEVVVVDSGSRDGTAGVAEALGARVISIRREDFQHGRTRQMASEAARGEFLVYLVADAEPADEKWLSTLVAAVREDERTAGAYSRQVPRDGAGPVEAFRLEHRLSSGAVRQVREVTPEMDFWALSAEERFRFCEFDDVSCCRRRSVVRQIPIPAVDWAEDLLWARAVLLAGYRLVLEPRSLVKHSHQDTIRHAFRRGWLDQRAVKAGFGHLYFDSLAALFRAYPWLAAAQSRAVLRSRLRPAAKAFLAGWNLLRLAAEMSGNFLAGADPRRSQVVYDLISLFAGRTLRRRLRSGAILRTRWALGADSRPVLFMNPNAAVAAELRIPAGARLEFGAALNPACRRWRRELVCFIVALEGEPVWEAEVSPGAPGKEPAWVEAAVDLERWAGRRVRLSFITRAKNTDYAWAGWSAPRIVVDGEGWRERLWNRLLAAAERRAAGQPLRHP